jgi:hypothetical protein
VKPADFARARGVTLRTVERWLGDGELPEAVKDSRGRWSIPADAMRQQPLPGTDMSPSRRGVTGPTRTDMSPSRRDMSAPDSLTAALDQLPALLSLEQASRVLGIPVSVVREQANQLQARPWGRRRANGERALVIPARVVRELAGL